MTYINKNCTYTPNLIIIAIIIMKVNNNLVKTRRKAHCRVSIGNPNKILHDVGEQVRESQWRY